MGARSSLTRIERTVVWPVSGGARLPGTDEAARRSGGNATPGLADHEEITPMTNQADDIAVERSRHAMTLGVLLLSAAHGADVLPNN